MANIVTAAKGEKFKDRLKQRLIDNEREFWEAFSMLNPKDKCDVYLKMLPYGFSKAPEEKPLDEAGRQKLILEKTTERATLIAGGLPEDTEYEPEEDLSEGS